MSGTGRRPTGRGLALHAAGVALTVALTANIVLAAVTRADDTFANVVAVASGVAAAGLVVSRLLLPRLAEEAAWLACGVWIANLVEVITADAVSNWSKLRQGGFYLAFALVAVSVYAQLRYAREAAEARS